ncbi:hypothetical protein Hdeb2414_s0013g00414451 [Helianthus debilis subsp. tardiflorus]
MTIMAFNEAILLTGVRTRPSMDVTKVATKIGDRPKFSTSVGLDTFYLGVKLAFSHGNKVR